MGGRFEVRRAELLAQAQVLVAGWNGASQRLETFVERFVESLIESARRRHFVEDASGLLSNLKRKTSEGIAYLHDQDRKQMQPFVGESPWEYAPLLTELARQVGTRIGEPDGVIVFDPSAFAKKGTKSVGVARQAAWTKLDVRDGEKGPLEIEVTLRRVQARTPTGGTGPDEMLFITRERQSDGTLKHDDDLSNADATTPVSEFARVAKAEHRIEECFHRGKSDAGLSDYQVRNGIGWHHHQTLSLIAAWFLNEETRRGKNPDTRHDGPSSPPVDRRSNRTPTPITHAHPHRCHRSTLAPTKRTRSCFTLRSS